MAIDEAKLNAFMGQFVNDFGAVMHAATIVVGDQFGLYKALAEGPATAAELARPPRPMRATCANGCRRRLPVVTCVTSPRANAYRIAVHYQSRPGSAVAPCRPANFRLADAIASEFRWR
nr:hypothetical protein [Polaromonas jejuensis]